MFDYAEHPLPPARREVRDVDYRFATLAALGVLLVLGLLGGISIWMFPGSLNDQSDIKPILDYPAPRLQPSPPADMKSFLQEQMAWLNSTGWIDRKTGMAHIPIDDAMRKVAASGITDWPKTAPTEVQRLGRSCPWDFPCYLRSGSS